MSVDKKIPVSLFQIVYFFQVPENCYRAKRKRAKTFQSRFFFLMLI